jgi:hypothetical protein
MEIRTLAGETVLHSPPLFSRTIGKHSCGITAQQVLLIMAKNAAHGSIHLQESTVQSRQRHADWGVREQAAESGRWNCEIFRVN